MYSPVGGDEWLSLWMSNWIIQLIDSFKSINSFMNKTSLYDWVTESFTEPIRTKQWFIKEQTKLLSMNESLNHLLNRLEQNSDSLRKKKQITVNEWVTESFTEPIRTKQWFIKE